MLYVTHTCKTCKCAFIAEDYTTTQDIPPTWRYCPKCAKDLNINYETQTPKNLPKELKRAIEKFLNNKMYSKKK